jgi:hypothetical protein
MRLDGRDLIVLSGAIFFYLDGPRLPSEPRLSPESDQLLESLGDRLQEATDAVYRDLETEKAPTRKEIVERRLRASLEWDFSAQEVELLKRALDATAKDLAHAYSDARIMLPIDEHGLTVEDFRSLWTRLDTV